LKHRNPHNHAGWLTVKNTQSSTLIASGETYTKTIMKKIFSLLLFIPLITFSQQPELLNTSKISLGLTFSLDYCYRLLISEDDISKYYGEQIDSIEFPQIGFTTGFNIRKKIRERISVSAGVNYLDHGIKVVPKYFLKVWYNGSNDTTPSIKEEYNYHNIYIDFPMKVDYDIFTGRAKLFLSLGLSPKIFLLQKQKSYLELKDGRTYYFNSTSKNGNKKLNLSIISGIGFNYELTKKIYLLIQPVFQFELIPEFTNYYDLIRRTYSIGLSSGIYCNF